MRLPNTASLSFRFASSPASESLRSSYVPQGETGKPSHEGHRWSLLISGWPRKLVCLCFAWARGVRPAPNIRTWLKVTKDLAAFPRERAPHGTRPPSDMGEQQELLRLSSHRSRLSLTRTGRSGLERRRVREDWSFREDRGCKGVCARRRFLDRTIRFCCQGRRGRRRSFRPGRRRGGCGEGPSARWLVSHFHQRGRELPVGRRSTVLSIERGVASASDEPHR